MIYPQILYLETVWKSRVIPGPPNNGTLLWQVSHTSPISLQIHYGSGMGIVWETYHKGVTLLGVPENPTDRVIQQSPKKLPAFKMMHLNQAFSLYLGFLCTCLSKKQIDFYIFHQFTCVCFSGVFVTDSTMVTHHETQHLGSYFLIFSKHRGESQIQV